MNGFENLFWSEIKARHSQLLAEATHDRLVKHAIGLKEPLTFRLMAWLADRLINMGMLIKRHARDSAKQAAYMSTGFMI